MSNQLSEADQFLLEAVRRGDAEGWAQLVSRYRGRLVAFARSRTSGGGGGAGAGMDDAEDLVQETFISFLKGVRKFRGEASLETYLFTILRRRIIDARRGLTLSTCSLQGDGGDDMPRPLLAAPDQTASWYARRDESHELHHDALRRALTQLTDDLRESGELQTLQILDAVFYGQMRNRDAAAAIGVAENLIGVTKHRWLKRIRDHLDLEVDGAAMEMWDAPDGAPSLLTEVWEELRPTCPKRSTIGRHLLGTLEEPWRSYVAFHLDLLGCRFCCANRDDLRHATQTPAQHDAMQQRMFQSTIGFLSRQ